MRILIIFLLFALAWNYYPLPLQAEDNVANVEADELEYLEKESKILAKGNVKVTYDKNVLKSSDVVYDQEKGLITATGNVQLHDSAGSSYFADSAEMDDTLTTGTINNLSGRMSDNALFAASKGIKKSEDVTVLENAVYSPCKICKHRMKGKPLWQISADKVTFDEGNEQVRYRNATLDIFGLPVLYTPWLSHATPNAKRKSGFLIPTYSRISTLGVTVKTPYYINIAPNMDATFEPIFTSEEGTILSGSFRHLTSQGSYELKGSLTNPRKRDIFGNRINGRETRGHIEGRGNFTLEDNWTWGFNVKRASDDTYLQRYEFGYEDLLTSRIYMENIDGRNYIGAEGVSFQGLNFNDDPSTTPLILPRITTHHEMKAGYKGSRFTFDTNTLILSRGEGVESRRLSGTAGWILPYLTKNGHLLEFTTRLRGDVYSVENVMDGALEKDGLVGRAIPEAQLSWSYPLAQKLGNNHIFIEPVAEIFLSPNGGNPGKIPNEDSQEIELSDVNLFSGNHFAGIDRIEGGPRSNYGIRGGITNPLGDISFLFGQNYRARTDRNFTPESGLSDNFSDYVGRITIENTKNTEFSYRFRMDKDDFIMRRNEIGSSFTFDRFQFNVGYVLLDEKNEAFDNQELITSGMFTLTDHWFINANGRRNLSEDGGWISTGAGIVYENECLRLNTIIRRDFTRDRDIEPSTSIMFQIAFKNLGQS